MLIMYNTFYCPAGASQENQYYLTLEKGFLIILPLPLFSFQGFLSLLEDEKVFLASKWQPWWQIYSL